MVKNLRKSAMKISVLFFIITALVLVLAYPAVAATPSTSSTTATPPILKLVQGQVTSIPNSTSFIIENAQKTSVTINVNGDTKYYLLTIGSAQPDVNVKGTQGTNASSAATALGNSHIPADWRNNLEFLDTLGKSGAFSDIAVGDRIIARVNTGDLAIQVLIIKVPVIRQVRGTVTISGNNITVNALSGVTIGPLTWDSNTEFIMKGVISAPSGQYGEVTYNNNTMVASLVNFAAKPPTASATTTTP